MDDLHNPAVKQGVKWSAERSEDALRQQPMRQATKPILRRQPDADQRKFRRQMRRQTPQGQTQHEASVWQPERQVEHQREMQPQPQAQPKLLQVKERTRFQPRTDLVTDDADFDPYLVKRCGDHGSSVTGDLESQKNYIRVATADHDHAMSHSDAEHRPAFHSDGGDCWSCCPQMYIAKPGERESGRTAARTAIRLVSVLAAPPCPECGAPGRDEQSMGATSFGHVETPGHCSTYTWAPDGTVLARDVRTKAERDAMSEAFDNRLRALNPFSRPVLQAETMLKGAPFAGYSDFDACVKANSDKDDPEAYCGKIKHQVEDSPKHKKSTLMAEAQLPGIERAGDRECQACGQVGSPVFGDTGPACSACGSYSLLKAPFKHPGQAVPEYAKSDYTRLSARTATRFETNVATADGRILVNPGDKINTPTGQTLTVNKVRRHETSRDHYYVDTDAGTTVVPYSTKFELVPQNSQQQSTPDLGTPGGNFVHQPMNPGAGAGSNVGPDACPVCGGKGSLTRQGDKYRCSRCGYTDSFMGNGMSFSDATQQLLGPGQRQSSINDHRGVIARRAAMVAGKDKETPL